jgi:uncharacterized protein YkwD
MTLQHAVVADPSSSEDVATSSPAPKPRRATRARRARRVAVVGAAVGVVMLLLGSCASADFTRLLDLVNADRAGRMGALEGNWPLINKAAAQAQAMGTQGRLFHSNLAANNPYAWRSLAENIAMVPSSGGVDAANAAFLNSQLHRANMENPYFQYMGAASFDDGRGTLWVVEEFMQL